MSSHHPTHAKANPSPNGTQPGARLGRFLFPNRPRPPISPELLKHELERAEARQNRAAHTARNGRGWERWPPV